MKIVCVCLEAQPWAQVRPLFRLLARPPVRPLARAPARPADRPPARPPDQGTDLGTNFAVSDIFMFFKPQKPEGIHLRK